MEQEINSKPKKRHLKKGNTLVHSPHLNDEGIIEARFRSKPVCPHCGAKGKGVSKKGKTSTGKQRFICQHCHKTFIATTNCAMHNSKKDFSVWEKYLRCFLEEKRLQEAAEECGISILTAWRWSHKICACLQNILAKKKNEKIIWAFELEFLWFESCDRIYNSPGYDEVRSEVDAESKKLEKYIKRFYGIKTKYLRNYAAWYYLTQYGHLSPRKQITLLHKLVCSDPCYTKVRDIGNKPATPAP